MKILKNIHVVFNPDIVTVGYEKNKEFKTIQSEIDIIYILNIVNARVRPDEELKEFLCQITQDQHMSIERIRYVLEDNSYRFIIIESMTIAEQSVYEQYKIDIQNELNKIQDVIV